MTIERGGDEKLCNVDFNAGGLKEEIFFRGIEVTGTGVRLTGDRLRVSLKGFTGVDKFSRRLLFKGDLLIFTGEGFVVVLFGDFGGELIEVSLLEGVVGGDRVVDFGTLLLAPVVLEYSLLGDDLTLVGTLALVIVSQVFVSTFSVLTPTLLNLFFLNLLKQKQFFMIFLLLVILLF